MLFENPGEYGIPADAVDDTRAKGIELLEALADDERMSVRAVVPSPLETTLLFLDAAPPYRC